jgi:hypothetical protein|tara:strand:+ start:546 stop:803 length:258 start_codon:yes stop_codon:yes gene_type:complete
MAKSSKGKKPEDGTKSQLDKMLEQLKGMGGVLTPEEQAEIDSIDTARREQRHLKIKKLLERAKKRAPVPMPIMKKVKKRKTGVIA